MKTPNQNQTGSMAGINRRRFLRGLGASIALPAFASLAPMRLLAGPSASAAAKAPMRMAFLYVPNGTIPSAWWPEGEAGKDFAMPRTLQPLEKLRQQVQIISGLEDINADPGRTTL